MELSNLAKIFKALSNEQRLKLFKMLYTWHKECKETQSQDECCCKGHVKAFSRACKCLTISRSTISHHFKELQNAGLISCSRMGQSFICRINQEAVDAIKKCCE